MHAALAKGVQVPRVRAISVMLAGAFAGLGGAAVAVGAVGNFGHNITAGKGFVALALVAVARHRIGLVLVAAIAFGTLEALQARLQDVRGIPVNFLPALPGSQWCWLSPPSRWGIVRGCGARREPPRDQIEIAPASAQAFELPDGWTIRVTDAEGSQVGDLFCVARDDPAERFSQARTRVYLQRIDLRVGDALWSTRDRPLLTVVEDTVGVHDLLSAAAAAPCSRSSSAYKGRPAASIT